LLRSLRSPRSASRGTIASLSPLVLLVACSYVWFSYTLMKEGGCVGISAGTRYELLTPQVACMLARVSVHACEQMWRASLSLRASGGQQRRRSGTTDGNAPFAVWGSDPPPLTRTLEVASSPGNPMMGASFALLPPARIALILFAHTGAEPWPRAVAVRGNPCLASRTCLCGFFRNGNSDGVSSALVPLLTSGGEIAVDTAPSVNAATSRDGL
jgi:hypothetical protein